MSRVALDVVDTAFKYINSAISASCNNPTTCDQVVVYINTVSYEGARQRWGPISTALNNDPNRITCKYDGSAFTCNIQFLAPVDGNIESIEFVARVLGNTVNIIDYVHRIEQMPISKGLYYMITFSLSRR